MTLKVTFSIDPTGLATDITDTISIPSNTCLYCLHDRELFERVVIDCLKQKGYNVEYYIGIMKIYSI
jgi:hypothetical protein